MVADRTVKVRFAPSPTGLLHVGNARTALVNWLFARSMRGGFLLRFDDTDLARSRAEYANAIEADLGWLGLDWSVRVRQSERVASYMDAFNRLRARGRVYPCYETPEELDYKRNRQRARGLPPIYDRSALRLTDDQKRAFEAEGRRPHWRFLLDDEPVSWSDLVRGPVTVPTDTSSDPVVMRADGSFLYLLPSMVDDIELGISHVIRGEDHVANTAVQIEIAEALGHPPPAFAHLPLLSDISGKGLSKRLGSLTLAELRAQGIEAMALAGYLATIGTGEPPRLAASLDELAADFDLSRFGRSTAKFDDAQLQQLNQRLLHGLDFNAVRDRLAALGLDGITEALWTAIRANLAGLSDARFWYEVCFGTIEPVIDDPALLAEALRLLPAEPWSEATWSAWTGEIGAATGRRGRALYRPLRLALTGAEHGPEMKLLLPLIGRDRVMSRLEAASGGG
jgi:glutamyl-tRNA synthetase